MDWRRGRGGEGRRGGERRRGGEEGGRRNEVQCELEEKEDVGRKWNGERRREEVKGKKRREKEGWSREEVKCELEED